MNDAGDLFGSKLVTVTAGGNDVGFGDLIVTCSIASLRDLDPGSTLLLPLIRMLSHELNVNPATFSLTSPSKLCSAQSPVQKVQAIQTDIQLLYAPLKNLFDHLVSSAPLAEIYAVGYPDLLPQPNAITVTERQRGCGSIGGKYLDFLSGVVPALDGVILRAANDAGIGYVDPNTGPLSFQNHSLCDPVPFFHAVDTSALLSSLSGSYHPNSLGQRFLALEVEAELRQFQASVSGACPSSAQIFATYKSLPGVVNHVGGEIKITGFSSPHCWRQWVLAEPIANPQGNGWFYFSRMGRLHGLSLNELQSFRSAMSLRPPPAAFCVANVNC